MTDFLTIQDDGPVRVITMTGSPRRGNPLSMEMTKHLLPAIEAAGEAENVHCIVLTGTDRHFSVGADISEFHQYTAIEAAKMKWLDEYDSLRKSAKPIVAAIRGHAVGGGFELALLCDLLVAAENAHFSLPETGIGVIAGGGGTQRLIQMAGRAIAADLILSGRVITGAEALQMGIVVRAVPPEFVLEEAVTLAKDIAARSPDALRFAREVIFEASEGHLQQSFRIERLLAYMVLDSEERKRRTSAFLEKKKS
jgi:enoyl-CoA hydratase/carnithine racemase